jgi:hypothetical protein
MPVLESKAGSEERRTAAEEATSRGKLALPQRGMRADVQPWTASSTAKNQSEEEKAVKLKVRATATATAAGQTRAHL